MRLALLTAVVATAAWAAAAEARPPAGFPVAAAFSSPLPLLVIEPVAEPPDASVGARIRVSLVASAGSRNRPDDAPALRSLAVWTREGMPAENGVKTSHALRLISASGADHPVAVLGMPSAANWTLCGSVEDRAMIRNHLARELAREMLSGGAPEARYCEVLLREGGELSYQGLYLLSEHVEDGVWLSPRALEGKRYLARMTADETSAGAETPGFEIVYGEPGAAAAVSELARIGAAIDSPELAVYFGGIERLDGEAFVDACIVVLALMNDAPGAPYCWYGSSRGGRVGIVPLWTFDRALGGAGRGAIGSLRRPWLGGLLRGKDFVERLKERYFGLRRGVLAPERLDARVDRLFADLREPMLRDWRRWEAAYARAGFDGEADDCRAGLEQVRLGAKHYLRMQGDSLKTSLLKLHWDAGLVDTDMNARRNVALACAFLLLFFLATVYARRRW